MKSPDAPDAVGFSFRSPTVGETIEVVLASRAE